LLLSLFVSSLVVSIFILGEFNFSKKNIKKTKESTRARNLF
jgi:hypothetical protein